MELIEWLNENIVWGVPMLLLFAAAGIIFTVRLKCFQIRKFPYAMKKTLFTKQPTADGKTISPFRTLTAALGTTLGTGNIIAIGTAIAYGGAGTIFWMWVSAALGMITCYAETYLGMKYRKRQSDGGYGGVPFAYINKAFGGKKAGRAAAVFFAVCCILASFGMGNMAQISSASLTLYDSIGVRLWITGLVCTALIAFLAPGGIERLGGLTSWLIPLASVGYIIGCLAVIIINIEAVPECFTRIFTEAFSFKAAAGGTTGAVMLGAMQWGIKRGVFSNEAGLGTAVIIHASSSGDDPKTQGMWAMLQVFADTIVMCSMTALCILTSGADKLSANGMDMAYIAFSDALGKYAGIFLCVSIFIFAVSTAAGWWIYGKSCVIYLLGQRWVKLYLAFFIVLTFIGAIVEAQVIWEISDLFNGLMAIPNLIAIIKLRKEIC